MTTTTLRCGPATHPPRRRMSPASATDLSSAAAPRRCCCRRAPAGSRLSKPSWSQLSAWSVQWTTNYRTSPLSVCAALLLCVSRRRFVSSRSRRRSSSYIRLKQTRPCRTMNNLLMLLMRLRVHIYISSYWDSYSSSFPSQSSSVSSSMCGLLYRDCGQFSDTSLCLRGWWPKAFWRCFLNDVICCQSACDVTAPLCLHGGSSCLRGRDHW